MMMRLMQVWTVTMMKPNKKEQIRQRDANRKKNLIRSKSRQNSGIMVSITQLISPAFLFVWRVFYSAAYNGITYIVLKGGRASGKSYTAPMMIIHEIMDKPISALCLRQKQVASRQSTFESIKQAIIDLGVEHNFKFTPSKLEITYLPRGNKIYFKGASEPDRIKSFQDSKFPVAILWIEELGEFKSKKVVQTIVDTILRKKLDIIGELTNRNKTNYLVIYTYNPPKRRTHWVNEEFDGSEIKKRHDVFVHHSTYLDNPYISKEFIRNAEYEKQRNFKTYQHNFLGIPVGDGDVPFENARISKGSITDEMVNNFTNIRNGLDFGYNPDPTAFIRVHYDKAARAIWVLDEVYETKKLPDEFAQLLKRRGYQHDMIPADGAVTANVIHMNRAGMPNVYAVKKGPGSVELGTAWLNDLDDIYVDPNRTPNFAREISEIEYMTDKDGKQLDRLEDGNDHLIDALRYAMNAEIMAKDGDNSSESIVDYFS